MRVKYTGESVVIIDQREEGGFRVVDVRRAKQTQNGIEYLSEVFHASELEQVPENIQREFNEALYRRDLMNKAEDAATAVASSGRVQ